MSNTVEIKNTKARFYTMNGVRIAPGTNKLSKKDAEKFLSHPHAQLKVSNEIFTVKGKVDIEAPKAAAVTVEAEKVETAPVAEEKPMTADELIAVIEETNDMALLEKSLDDRRVTVQRAAQNRIEELSQE